MTTRFGGGEEGFGNTPFLEKVPAEKYI